MGMHRVKCSNHYLVISQGSSVSPCVDKLPGAIERGGLKLAPIVVVFPSEEERKRVDLPEEIRVLIGDPTSRETLERANAERASHVVLALEEDSKAVFVTLLVKRMSQAKVLVEVLSEEGVELLDGARRQGHCEQKSGWKAFGKFRFRAEGC
ncbi:NAD-binding protein [Thermococcus sp.]